jgi:hypothetical protein
LNAIHDAVREFAGALRGLGVSEADIREEIEGSTDVVEETVLGALL